MSRPAAVNETRIRDFNVSTYRPVVGETVEFTGYLEFKRPLTWWWEPVEGEPVHLVVDGQVVDTQPTGKGGWFKLRWAPTKTGKYLAWVRYDGSIWNNPCESAKVGIEVITEEQRRQEEMRLMGAIAVVGGVVVAAVAGIAAYLHYQRQREEMVTLMAARGR